MFAKRSSTEVGLGESRTDRQRGTEPGESETSNPGRRVGRITSASTSTASIAWCGPACPVVWEGSGLTTAPYPNFVSPVYKRQFVLEKEEETP